MERPVRSMLLGALAGAAGTLAMDVLWYRRFRAGGGSRGFIAWETSEGTEGFEEAGAPARTAKAVADLVGVHLPESTARTMNNVVHWGTGIGWGEAHGAVASLMGTSNPLLGPVTAVVAWATSYAVLPLLGVYEPVREYGRETLQQDLTAHLVFGAVLGVGYRLLSGTRD